MTINAQTGISGTALGDGTNVVFPFDFKVGGTDEVSVYVDGQLVDESAYTVNLSEDWSGDVTFDIPPVDDAEVVLASNPSFVQRSVHLRQGPFYPDIVESDLDRAVLRDIYLRRLLLSTFRLPEGLDPATYAGKFPVVLPDGSTGFASGTGADIGLRADLAVPDGGLNVGYRQSGTGARTRDMRAKARDTFSTRDFCVGDGVTNDTTNLQNALNAAAGKTLYIDEGTILINSNVTPANNTKIIGRGGEVKVSTANVVGFNIQNKTGVKLLRVKVTSTVAGLSAYVVGVTLDNSTYCEIRGCEISGFQWGGVYLAGSSHNIISGNTFGAIPGNINDSADINIYLDSSDNIIRDNKCLGGGWVGINIQDPGGLGTYLPARNKVTGNTIGATKALGINCYIGSPGTTIRNSDNYIAGNTVSGTTGAANPTGNGSGIYCVGDGIGGLIVRGNRVNNCCISTTARANGQAGVTISGFGDVPGYTGTAVAPVVDGNIVTGMTRGDGISVISCFAGCVVGPNSVEMPASNTGGLLPGNAFRIDNSIRVTATGGSYVHLGNSDAVYVYASSNDLTDISMSTLHVRSAGAYGLRVDRFGSYATARCSFANFTGSAGAAWSLRNVSDSSVSGFTITTSNAAACEIYDSPRVTFHGNFLSGATCVFTSGTCTGSRLGLSNFLNGNVENNATGLTIMRYGTAVPTLGKGALGDQIINTAGVVGQPKGWTCTATAGAGTWTSQGNL